MDLKKYEKTRYQNIYRNIKNKNYIVMMSKPVKTSIATIEGEKILKLEDAVKIRDNYKIKAQKGIEIGHKEEFDYLLDKYLEHCKNDLKLSYNSIKKKRILFNKYFKNNFEKITKIKKDDMVSHIGKLNCSDKQKNEIIKIIKPFFNWCVKDEEIIFKSPMDGINLYKVTKTEMKYWLPIHLKKILETINEDIYNQNLLEKKYYAYLIKMVILIGFSLGDRIGETRALRFKNIKEDLCYINIEHSINYDPNDDNYLAPTKTENSSDVIYTTEKLISEILQYKNFLINEMNLEITEETPVLYNYKTKKPYSDTRLRKLFNYYIEKANVPRIRMYDLRHTTATTLMSEGYDMYVIQDKLRHKSIKTTIDKYGHITANKRKEIAKITDKYF